MPKLNSSWVVQAVSWDTSNAGFWYFLTEQEIEPWFLPLPAESANYRDVGSSE